MALFRPFIIRAFVIAIGAMAVACGGDDSPTAPTPSVPTVTNLTIAGLDALRTGFFSNYTATATMSDGTSQTVSPTWLSSNSGVATVDNTGRVTGVTHGTIILTASHQGRNATKTVSVVNNYAGAWSGTYVIRACDQSGAFATARWCQNLGGVGAILPVSLGLNQLGNDRTQITGVLALGSLAGNITGNITADGRLVLGGAFNVTSSGITFTFQFGGWDTRLNGPGVMVGRWAQNLTAIGAAGNQYQENELVTMLQTSTSVTTAVAPSHYTLSWDELFSRLR